MSADYLFMQDKPYDVSYDTGDKAIQCGRHNDVFKLWIMWKSKVCNQSLAKFGRFSNEEGSGFFRQNWNV